MNAEREVGPVVTIGRRELSELGAAVGVALRPWICPASVERGMPPG